MPLVNAKCTNCGANLKVDSTKDAAICEFCGSAYIVEKAINNYNITNNNNINANVVNIYGGNSADFIIRAGTLEKYNGASTDVVIPNTVTRIDSNAFVGCTGLTSISIPDSVTVIEDDTFRNCTGLMSVKIPNSVTSIGAHAFEKCSSLTNISIPNSVTCIYNCVFKSCTGLQSIEIPNSVIKIGGSAFRGCSNLTSIKIPNSVTIIRDSAFRNCTRLSNVKIPQGCDVDQSAFLGTQYQKDRYREYRREHHLCQHCGSEFKGLFNKICSKCGKPKDY